MEYNLKQRELYCPYCKIYSMSDKSDPKCEKCSHGLITVIYSMNGIRMNDVKKD